MGRYRKELFENFQSQNFNPDTKYELAYKRVKRMKGFYVHAFVYVCVNAFIIISIFNRSVTGSDVFFRWETFSTALFWGIGLMAHGFSVFGRDLFFGADWEDRKIKEFMDNEKNKKWE